MQKPCFAHVDAAEPCFLRHHWRFFLLFSLIAIAFRVWFLLQFRMLTADSFVYGDIAKNWLESGIYGISLANGPEPTYIRMPGYPAFLASIWRIVGMEHYTAVLIVQIVIDLGTCFLIADLTRRFLGPRTLLRLSSRVSAGSEVEQQNSRVPHLRLGSAEVGQKAPLVAFALAALCPLFASYSSAALTETLAIFFAALSIDLALVALGSPERKARWIVCGIALAAGIFLRPDGGMLLMAIGAYLLWRFFRTRQMRFLTAIVLIGVFSLAPLIPWTIRNWKLYHLFQPLTPINANAPDEFVAYGFQKWFKTWVVDYSSLEDIWFNVPFTEISVDDLPARAFDSPQQKQETEELFNDYNSGRKVITPELDARFAQLANQRIRDSRFRYYVWLPLLRLADLCLRPRTEMLPIDVHWWHFSDDPHDFSLALLLALINAFYLAAATVGAFRWRGCLFGIAIVTIFIAIRSVFLMYMPNPEPRYMLECYPAILALAGIGLAGRNQVPAVARAPSPASETSVDPSPLRDL